MKTTLIFSSITGLIFLPSCVCNTSGKLDTVGKTRHALIVEHPNTSMQPAPGLRTLHPSAFTHGS